MLKFPLCDFEPTDDKCMTGINDFDVRQPVVLFSTSNVYCTGINLCRVVLEYEFSHTGPR